MAYRILVVEDEPDTRELLDTTLRRSGHRVDIASSGRDALQLLAEYSNDVILSSPHMPEMSGEELYWRIDHGWPHLAPRMVFVPEAPPDSPLRPLRRASRSGPRQALPPRRDFSG
ncbi:MAG TPA: response regulator [Methylomirabilota bacterium]